ncbi:FAS1-like dehydratase domain-containing protein [Paraburkholderia humisilvae]|uniref:Mesaconyl-C(4)-CoA hydratase n=1 Tax=Paraburkholderia humisilvae TaxID=627669 RepID=A0A6J5EA85_9BURK|nr:MaoC family dehydratase N-terminal domain-containing protein [Paraburkholderia humisilvae]CAB3762236.1 Mesaconyl-C(4)-CoA hydratase [Paraburkholderia humisilvae]
MPQSNPSLDTWVGRSESHDDYLSAFPVTALAATLERAVPPGTIPPLWHWLYFLPVAPLSDVGPDGHPKRGGFLPPVALPRRMWAGGRLTFHAPLEVGGTATRTSTIEKVDEKTGRTGKLVFVTVSHSVAQAGRVAIEEEHDIVYRDPPQPAEASKVPERAPDGEHWSRTIHPDPVMLFRYSALTFNGHRIHYDYPYVTNEEGYPDLVVHGPLIATCLIDLVHREQPAAVVRRFEFRAQRPTFANRPFTVCGVPSADGKTVELWAKDHEGYQTMRATAQLA